MRLFVETDDAYLYAMAGSLPFPLPLPAAPPPSLRLRAPLSLALARAPILATLPSDPAQSAEPCAWPQPYNGRRRLPPLSSVTDDALLLCAVGLLLCPASREMPLMPSPPLLLLLLPFA